MNIIPINNIRHTTSFKCNENNVIAYDDIISQQRRKYIREHYYRNYPQMIYQDEPRLDEYSLQKVIDKLKGRTSTNFSNDEILKLPLWNLKNISSSEEKPKIYRGQSLVDQPNSIFERLHKAGIKTVIDLNNYGQRYKKKVEKAGMEFFEFCIYKYWINSEIDKSSREFIEPFIKFIQKMQEEYIYIGCEYGTLHTDIAVMLNSYFNPKMSNYNCPIISPFLDYQMEDVYKGLNVIDKIKLGWTKDFEKEFLKRMRFIFE